MSARTDLLEAIRSAPADMRWSDEAFDAHARTVFAHQFETVAPFRRLCENRGLSPDSMSSYREVPGVPTDAFKQVYLGDPATEVERTFLTSGTTQGARGSHHFQTLEFYRAAIGAPFLHYGLGGSSTRLPLIVLAPSPGDLPESSLSFMLGELLRSAGHPMMSGFFLVREGDELVFDWDGVVRALDLIRGPVGVLGTAFAFVEMFDTVDRTFELAPGSFVMETGGLKGKTREVSRDELYGMFESRLGIPTNRCVGEYSMTELSSQAYTDNLQRDVSYEQGRFQVPPWVRIEIVEPSTLEILESPGERGLIRWYDLANVDSVFAVQTSDLGVKHNDGGFSLLGRAPEAELRGCSLTIEELT